MARKRVEPDYEKCAAIKMYGTEQYVAELLTAFKQDNAERIQRLRAIVEEEKQLRSMTADEWETLYQEELARARGAAGLIARPSEEPQSPGIPI